MLPGVIAPTREELEQLRQQLAEARLAHECSEGTLAMTVARVGGTVEGAPTGRHNFLQRIDELRRIEAAVLLRSYPLPVEGERVELAAGAGELIGHEGPCCPVEAPLEERPAADLASVVRAAFREGFDCASRIDFDFVDSNGADHILAEQWEESAAFAAVRTLPEAK